MYIVFKYNFFFIIVSPLDQTKNSDDTCNDSQCPATFECGYHPTSKELGCVPRETTTPEPTTTPKATAKTEIGTDTEI